MLLIGVACLKLQFIMETYSSVCGICCAWCIGVLYMRLFDIVNGMNVSLVTMVCWENPV